MYVFDSIIFQVLTSSDTWAEEQWFLAVAAIAVNDCSRYLCHRRCVPSLAGIALHCPRCRNGLSATDHSSYPAPR